MIKSTIWERRAAEAEQIRLFEVHLSWNSLRFTCHFIEVFGNLHRGRVNWMVYARAAWLCAPFISTTSRLVIWSYETSYVFILRWFIAATEMAKMSTYYLILIRLCLVLGWQKVVCLSAITVLINVEMAYRRFRHSVSFIFLKCWKW